MKKTAFQVVPMSAAENIRGFFGKQLTIKQHKFDLHGSTYTYFFSINIQLGVTSTDSTKLVWKRRIFDLWLGICGCGRLTPCHFL